MPARRRSREEWKVLLEAFDASDEGEQAFCAAHGMSLGYFRKKRALLARARQPRGFVRAAVAVRRCPVSVLQPTT